MFKVDLHTHSANSPDGGLTGSDYHRMLKHGGLDFVAVTDHNNIDLAVDLQRELGDKIIVGEEIAAQEGEVIGLFLVEAIERGLGAADTAAKIHEQGGLVYIPHPFASVRQGCLSQAVLDAMAEQVDIVEIHNGRAIFQKKNQQAQSWAAAHHKVGAASSDAHGPRGWGKTYTVVTDKPTRENLVELLAQATHHKGFVGVRGVLYPKSNRIKKKFRHG